MTDRLDRASVGALVARAAILLAHVREREAFHARVLAERICSSWLAPSMSLDDLLGPDEGPLHDADGARIRALLRARAEAVRARSPEELPRSARIVELLRSERARAERAREDVAAMLRAAGGEGTCTSEERASLVRLLGSLTTVLELRILAERVGDPERAERLDAERDRWIAVARRLVARTDAEPAAGEAITKLRPLAGRVVLSVARVPGVLGRLAAMLEDAGATTVLASSCRAALSLARWFHVDAALCVVEGGEDPLLTLAEATRSAFTRRGTPPLLVALLSSREASSPGVPSLGERASSSGFDAAIPMDLADPRGLWITVSLAIQARRVGVGRRAARRSRTRPGASM